MQDLYLAIEFEKDQPGVAGFASYLQGIGFPHRISEYQAGLALWVFDESDVRTVKRIYKSYLDNALPDSSVSKTGLAINLSGMLRFPLTMALIILSVAGFFAVTLEWLSLIDLFSFQGFGIEGDAAGIAEPSLVRQKISGGEFWRLFTPVFLHFDFMHVGFNMAFLWFLASQVERREGSIMLLVNVLFLGCVSNLVQFFMVPAHLFGGMSGVNYGLLAFCVFTNFLARRIIYQFPPGLLLFSVVMMLAGFLGLFSLFGHGIANWAHLSGLMAGFFLALIMRGIKYLTSS